MRNKSNAQKKNDDGGSSCSSKESLRPAKLIKLPLGVVQFDQSVDPTEPNEIKQVDEIIAHATNSYDKSEMDREDADAKEVFLQ
jgi:hypothetical protein